MTEAFADDRKMDGRNGRFRLSCNGGAGTDGKPEGGGVGVDRVAKSVAERLVGKRERVMVVEKRWKEENWGRRVGGKTARGEREREKGKRSI